MTTLIRDALCKDKAPGEFFRLVAGDTHCRDVVACTESALQAIRYKIESFVSIVDFEFYLFFHLFYLHI